MHKTGIAGLLHKQQISGKVKDVTKVPVYGMPFAIHRKTRKNLPGIIGTIKDFGHFLQ